MREKQSKRIERMSIGGSVYEKERWTDEELETAINCTTEVLAFLRSKGMRFLLAITPLAEQLETMKRSRQSRSRQLNKWLECED